jgi:hypothetical protein
MDPDGSLMTLRIRDKMSAHNLDDSGLDSRMELLIEFRDNNRPLEKPAADALVEEIRAANPPEVVSVSLRERRPGFGELGSLAHIWQVALDLATSHQALAAGGTAAIASALRPIFKILEKRQEQKIVLKGPGFELQGPASMFSDHTGELMDRVKEAIASKEKGAVVQFRIACARFTSRIVAFHSRPSASWMNRCFRPSENFIGTCNSSGSGWSKTTR